jgi:hypothetical protein
MQPIWLNGATFAVVLIYYVWNLHRQMLERRRRKLRERVAYMLWVMAEEIESPETTETFESTESVR